MIGVKEETEAGCLLVAELGTSQGLGVYSTWNLTASASGYELELSEPELLQAALAWPVSQLCTYPGLQ